MNNNTIIITRFNIGIHSKGLVYFSDRPLLKRPTSPEEWELARLKLFKTLLIPSLASQTTKEFTWIIVLDTGTSETIRNALVAYLEDYRLMSRVTLVFTGSEFIDSCPNDELGVYAMVNARSKGASHIRTLTVDTDTVISKHMVEWLNKQSPDKTTIYNSYVSTNVAMDQDGDCSHMEFKYVGIHTSCYAVIAPATDPHYVLEFPHWEIYGHPTIYDHKMTAIQVHHSSNICMIGMYGANVQIRESGPALDRFLGLITECGVPHLKVVRKI